MKRKDSILQKYYYSKLPKHQVKGQVGSFPMASSQLSPSTLQYLLSGTQQAPPKTLQGLPTARELAQGNRNYSSDAAAANIRNQAAEAFQLKRKRDADAKQTYLSQGTPRTKQSDARRYQLNKQYALETGSKFNYKTGDIARRNDKTAKGGDWGYVETPELVQTAAMATPSGRDYDAGAAGANVFVNMNPITAPIASTGRLTQLAVGQNPYGFNEDGVASNILPGLGLLGDIAGVRSFGLLPGAPRFMKPSYGSTRSIDIARNKSDLNFAKQWAKQYGYTLPKNLSEIAKSTKATNQVIKQLADQHNTFVRGVSTNWDFIQKNTRPEVWEAMVENFKKNNIDYINNPQQAAEFMSTHIPINTGYGRAGVPSELLNKNIGALYASNSEGTGLGYTYGNGYLVKVKRPTKFTGYDRRGWLKQNEWNMENPASLINKEVDEIQGVPIRTAYMVADGAPSKLSLAQKVKLPLYMARDFVHAIPVSLANRYGKYRAQNKLPNAEKSVNYAEWDVTNKTRQLMLDAINAKHPGLNLTLDEVNNPGHWKYNMMSDFDRISGVARAKLLKQQGKDVNAYNMRFYEIPNGNDYTNSAGDIKRIAIKDLERGYEPGIITAARHPGSYIDAIFTAVPEFEKYAESYKNLINLKNAAKVGPYREKLDELIFRLDDKPYFNRESPYVHYTFLGKPNQKVLDVVSASRVQDPAWAERGLRIHQGKPTFGLSRKFYHGGEPIPDQMGQWKYPGIPTRIMGNEIDMRGLIQPLVSKTNQGIPKLLLPNMQYKLNPMTQFVDEHPIPYIPQTTGRTPMVRRDFGGEKPPKRINLSLPKMDQKRGKVRINPYIYYERPNPNVDILGAGFQGNMNLNNRWNFGAGINAGRLNVPRENFSRFFGPSYNVGASYRFRNGGYYNSY